MHLGRADLHLNRAMATNHRRVQGLVAVGLGQADVVLEAAGDRAEGVMHHRQGAVAALDVRANDPQRRHVVDLVEGLALALHLVPDAIEVFRPSADLALRQPHRGQLAAEDVGGHPEALLPVAALAGDLLLDIPEGLGLEDLEGQVLQLPLEATDAQAVRQGPVDLTGFPGDALLLLGLQRPQGAHVVEAIRQLHEHHADVTGHGQEHAAQVFGLGLGLVGEVNATQLGDPLHQAPHLRAEVLLDLLGRDLGVLHHVMEETGGDHPGTRTDVPQQIGDGDRMADVGLTAGPHLAVVELKGEIEGGGQQRFGVGGAAFPSSGGNVLDAGVQPRRQLNAVVRGAVDDASTECSPGDLAVSSGRCPVGGGSVCRTGDRLEHSALRFAPSYAGALTNRPQVRVCPCHTCQPGVSAAPWPWPPQPIPLRSWSCKACVSATRGARATPWMASTCG